MKEAMDKATHVLILTCVFFSSFLFYIAFTIKGVSNKSLKLREDNSYPIQNCSTSSISSSSSSSSHKLPPGPRPYLIIGNILDLGSNALMSITNLSKSYGPIMSLKLGTRTSIVISSPEIAKEAFHNHDLDFSGRTFPDSARGLNHHQSMASYFASMESPLDELVL